MRKTKSPYLSIVGWGMFLAGALTLGSCTNEDIPGKDEQGPAIEFGEVKTRAEVSEASQVKEFSVFAEQSYLNEDGSESTDFISLLDNERVYRTGTNMEGEFTYDNTRYWVNERTFRFFAVYPFIANTDNSQNVKPTVTTTLKQGEYEYKGYQIPFVTPENADFDIMTAKDVVLIPDNPTNYPTVDFQFVHALSKINIKVAKNKENSENKVVLKKITLSHVYAEGTYNVSHNENYNNYWEITNKTNTLTFERIFVSDTEEGLELTTSGNETINGLMLIPYNHQAQVVIEYEYFVSDNETDGEEGSGEGLTKRATATLPGDWVAGQQYTYNIELQAEDNKIRFKASIKNPWSKQTGATILIQ